MRTLSVITAGLLSACAAAESVPSGGSPANDGGSPSVGGSQQGGSPNEGGGGAAEGAGGDGGSAEGGAGGSPQNGGGGAGGCDPTSCQNGIASLADMPTGTTTLTFDSCVGGCACCAGGSYADPITNDCITCSLDATLSANGITRSGGLGAYFVDCISGNPAAPIAHAALYAGGSELTLDFAEPVNFVGFSALPTSSDSQPPVTLEGYTASGELTGIDSFDFLVPGGDCETSNPAARFFGFRGCCGPIVHVVVTFGDPNTAIDTLSFY